MVVTSTPPITIEELTAKVVKLEKDLSLLSKGLAALKGIVFMQMKKKKNDTGTN